MKIFARVLILTLLHPGCRFMKQALHKFTAARMINLCRYIELVFLWRCANLLSFSDSSHIRAKGSLKILPALDTDSYPILTIESQKTYTFVLLGKMNDLGGEEWTGIFQPLVTLQQASKYSYALNEVGMLPWIWLI